MTSIGGNLFISYNSALTCLTGLNNLTSIGGYLGITDNAVLTSLTGVANIDAESITNLYIYYNYSLSTCEVQSICDYLASPNGNLGIFQNATGCNSTEEVETACEVGLDESNAFENLFNIYPIPSTTTITISTPATPDKNTFLTIIDITGKEVLKFGLTQEQLVVDVSRLSQGIYFVRISNDRTVMVGKFVKQ